MEKKPSCQLIPVQLTRVGYNLMPFFKVARSGQETTSPETEERVIVPPGTEEAEEVPLKNKECEANPDAIDEPDAVSQKSKEQQAAPEAPNEREIDSAVRKGSKVLPKVSEERETALLNRNPLPGDHRLQAIEQATGGLMHSFQNFVALVADRPLYVCSALFLLDCREYLTADHDEMLHFVSGIQFQNFRVMHHLAKVEMESRSVVHAASGLRSTARELIKMDEYGHSLLGIFHSQPGRGRGSVLPSGTDMATQERFERGGYPVISAIFNREGFVRFFSHRLEFEVTIYGKGAVAYGDNTFRILEL